MTATPFIIHPSRHNGSNGYCGKCSHGFYYRAAEACGWQRAPECDKVLERRGRAPVTPEATELPALNEVVAAWYTPTGTLYFAPLGLLVEVAEMCNCLRWRNGFPLIENQQGVSQ